LILRRSAKEDDTLPENRFKPKYKRDAEAAADVAKARHIVFSCDAGMGSSALGATRFRKRIEPLALDVKVTNSSVNSIPEDADIVICQQGLVSRAKGNAPKVRIVSINNFLEDPALDSLYEELSKRSDKAAEAEDDVVTGGANHSVLQMSSIKVGATAVDKWDAIAEAGNLLVKGGYVKMEYVDAMMERERIATTYLGMGIAIPHGTESAKKQVLRSGITVVQYPEGVDFDGEKAYLVIGIAGVGDQHLELLARVSEALEDEDILAKLKTTTDPEEIYKVLNA
jgi:PTS system mannitol-specific IIC component